MQLIMICLTTHRIFRQHLEKYPQTCVMIDTQNLNLFQLLAPKHINTIRIQVYNNEIYESIGSLQKQ